jgi:hypothetical protein
MYKNVESCNPSTILEIAIVFLFVAGRYKVLTSALDEGGWPALCPSHFAPGEKATIIH